ncbi:MAG TPA: DUF3617 domain-containing protein [Anaeromyxobacter sp.]
MEHARALGLFFVVAATAGATTARAEPFDVKPGLWEVTTTSETSGALPIDTSKLTPEQRGRLEAAMKARQGTRTHTLRSCLTQEKLDRGLFSPDKENAKCKHTVVASTRTVREVKIDCTGDRPMTGDLRFEALTRERVKGDARMTVGEGARSMKVNSTTTARWIGSDCGSVK